MNGETNMESNIYTVPAPMAAALGSGRGKMFAMLFNKEIDGGYEVPMEQVKEIIRLAGDLIEDNQKLKTSMRRMKDANERMTELLLEMVGLRTNLLEVQNVIEEEIDEHIKD